MPVTSHPLHARLREATRAAHHHLDHHPLLAPLLRHDLSLADYARALAALHAPQASLEALLADHLPATDFPPRRSALAADLDDLATPPQPLRAPCPEAGNDAQRLGLLYVLEGSNLGASHIARRLAHTLPQAPRRYFTTDANPQRWERYWALVATLLPARSSDDVVCATACAGFAFYREHMDACRG